MACLYSGSATIAAAGQKRGLNLSDVSSGTILEKGMELGTERYFVSPTHTPSGSPGSPSGGFGSLRLGVE